jgi:hypothetical protein
LERHAARAATFIAIAKLRSLTQEGKQWKRARARRRNLIKLGINPGEVYKARRSRKGYWRISQNSLVRFALNNRYLKEQGVPELRDCPAAKAASKKRGLYAKPTKEAISGSDCTTEIRPNQKERASWSPNESYWNRPVRTRMPGGVGGVAGAILPPRPDSALAGFWWFMACQ